MGNNLILVLTEDLLVIPRIEDVANFHGYRVMAIRHPEEMGAKGDFVKRSIPLTEPLEGPDGIFIRRVAEIGPALLLIDAKARTLPWLRWVQTLKTSAATRRIPIVVFGPHAETEMLNKAHRAGADLVTSRGRFIRSLPDLILEWARVPDIVALSEACHGGLPELVQQGINLINAGEYFEAHEELEHGWMSAPEHEGYLYRALLQVSVAYLHIERGNYAGAVKMLLRIHQWLDPLPARCRGVEVGKLKGIVSNLREALLRVGPEGLAKLDRTLLRPIPLILDEKRS